ncbi:MAG: hypothetical protein L0211_13855 [Planctomycetaceae bacterium]|nr:hypothetical protein [Planctomycetaceae bacterium]
MPAKKWPPPRFPIVEGRHAITDTWSIDLEDRFARRIEDGDLVLWRPGITIWLAVWNNDHGKSQAERLASIKESAAPARFDECEAVTGKITRYSYRLRDKNEDGAVESVYGYMINDDGQLEMAVYFDDPADEANARKLVDSVAERGRGRSGRST